MAHHHPSWDNLNGYVFKTEGSVGDIHQELLPRGDRHVNGGPHSMMHVVKMVGHKEKSACDINTMEMFEELTTLLIIIFATTGAEGRPQHHSVKRAWYANEREDVLENGESEFESANGTI